MNTRFGYLVDEALSAAPVEITLPACVRASPCYMVVKARHRVGFMMVTPGPKKTKRADSTPLNLHQSELPGDLRRTAGSGVQDKTLLLQLQENRCLFLTPAPWRAKQQVSPLDRLTVRAYDHKTAAHILEKNKTTFGGKEKSEATGKEIPSHNPTGCAVLY